MRKVTLAPSPHMPLLPAIGPSSTPSPLALRSPARRPDTASTNSLVMEIIDLQRAAGCAMPSAATASATMQVQRRQFPLRRSVSTFTEAVNATRIEEAALFSAGPAAAALPSLVGTFDKIFGSSAAPSLSSAARTRSPKKDSRPETRTSLYTADSPQDTHTPSPSTMADRDHPDQVQVAQKGSPQRPSPKRQKERPLHPPVQGSTAALSTADATRATTAASSSSSSSSSSSPIFVPNPDEHHSRQEPEQHNMRREIQQKLLSLRLDKDARFRFESQVQERQASMPKISHAKIQENKELAFSFAEVRREQARTISEELRKKHMRAVVQKQMLEAVQEQHLQALLRKYAGRQPQLVIARRQALASLESRGWKWVTIVVLLTSFRSVRQQMQTHQRHLSFLERAVPAARRLQSFYRTRRFKRLVLDYLLPRIVFKRRGWITLMNRRIVKKRRAVTMIVQLMRNFYHGCKMKFVIRRFLNMTRMLQRLIRNFLACKSARMTLLLRQWEQAEQAENQRRMREVDERIQWIKRELHARHSGYSRSGGTAGASVSSEELHRELVLLRCQLPSESLSGTAELRAAAIRDKYVAWRRRAILGRDRWYKQCVELTEEHRRSAAAEMARRTIGLPATPIEPLKLPEMPHLRGLFSKAELMESIALLRIAHNDSLRQKFLQMEEQRDSASASATEEKQRAEP